MIETYKLLSGKYGSQAALKLPLYSPDDHHTRGNSRKLLVKRWHCDLRKYFFQQPHYQYMEQFTRFSSGRYCNKSVHVPTR